MDTFIYFKIFHKRKQTLQNKWGQENDNMLQAYEAVHCRKNRG